jgi:hypothetical protein
MNGRTIGGVLCALLTAALLIVIWPTFGNLWWLTFVAFVPMYVAQYRLLPRRWSGLAVAVAFGTYYFALFLHASSVLSMGPIIGIGVGAAIVGGVIGIFLRPFAERSNYRWFVVQLPLIWVAIDLLVQNNEIIGTYMWIGYRLAPVPQLVQPVSITGTPALSLLIHVVNAAFALVVIALIDRVRPALADVPVPRRVLTWSVAIPVAAVTVWIAASLLIYRDVTNRMGPEVRVAAVQPGLDNATPGTLISAGNITPGRTQDQRVADQITQLTAMTKEAAAKGAKVVVWPEETLDYDPRVSHTDWIPALVRQTGVYLAMGFTPDPENGAAPNTGLLWSPQGEVKIVYLKSKRVIVEGEKFTRGTDGGHPTGHPRHDHLLRHRLSRRPCPQDRPKRGADDPGAQHRLRVDRRRAGRLNGIPRHRESGRDGQGRCRVGLGDRRARRQGGHQHRGARRARRAGPADRRRPPRSARRTVHAVRRDAVPGADLRRPAAADRGDGGLLAAAPRGPKGSGPAGSRPKLSRDLLAGPPTGPLTRQHHPLLEDLPAPHAPRFFAFESVGQTGPADRACGTQGLGLLEIGRVLGEPQIRVAGVARQQGFIEPDGGHGFTSSSLWATKKATDVSVRGLVCMRSTT